MNAPGIRSSPVDRLSGDDLMSLLRPGGPPPLLGAVLMLESEPDPAHLLASLERRLPALPRLRRRLLRVPPGCGRPVWVDDPRFRIGDHVSVVRCPAPADREALMALAAARLTSALPPDRPLWAATLVTGIAGGQAALIFTLHHVLADGMAGLAILAGLSGLAPESADPAFPRPAPSRPRLMLNAALETLRGLRHVPAALTGLTQVAALAGRTLATRLPPTSLNRPTGPRRRLATVDADLDRVHAAGRAAGATVNDVVLCAVTGALHRLMAARGEPLDSLVVSVLVSGRRQSTAASLGNQSAAVPLRLPTLGGRDARLRATAHLTRAARRLRPGATNALLRPLFGLLSGLGLYQRFIDHQRVVHTFVTNVRGPEHRLNMDGIPVLEMLPLATATGNITVSFAVLSYAGRLRVTLVADPDTCPDLEALRDMLQAELDTLVEEDGVPTTGPSDSR